MMRLLAFLILAPALTAAVGEPASAPPATGAEPVHMLGSRDIFVDYHLPPLADQPEDALAKSARKLQVLTRADMLHLNAHSATAAWVEAEDTFAHARAATNEAGSSQPAVFHGTRASALNALLGRRQVEAIVVTSAQITLDEPIRIQHDRTALDLGRARILPSPKTASPGPYCLRIEGVTAVRVSGGEYRPELNRAPAPWAVLISTAKDVVVRDARIGGLSGGGILVTNSDEVTVWGNKFEGLQAAPVLLSGRTHRSTVAYNEIVGNLGSSNWNAGVVLTDRNVELAQNPALLLARDGYRAAESPIVERLDVPEDNVVAFNHIEGNSSSGIYSDGSVRTVIVGNRVDSNSKEGTCLDNGSTADVIAFNLYQGNGKRWGRSDADLQRDYVLGAGRLPDGSSAASLPAISIDNAAYNQVLCNEIDRNFGGGIKMVRSGYYNLIGLNVITDDNEGQSERFHFFGIELGAARADEPVKELDFTPSRGNEIFGNTIRGSHYAGIFFADGSDRNMVFDNSIFGATAWAMESVRPQANESLNNVTNLKLRNISAGLDSKLIQSTSGQFDAPITAARP